MERVMYKSAEDFLQRQAERAWSSIGGQQPNYMTADGIPMHLEGAQASATLDPNYQRTYPGYAALLKYKEGAPENSLSYKAGGGIRNSMMNGIRNPEPEGYFGATGPMTGAMTMGAPAALLGAGAGYLADKVSGNRKHKWMRRAAIGAGLIGAGMGAYTGYWRNKTASWWKTDPDSIDQVTQVINASPGLSYQQKDLFAQAASRLSEPQAQQLLHTIMSAGGFGIGAILARYLMGAGLGGTIMGGLAGSLVGNAIAPPHPTDAFGRNSLGNNDLFGHHII